MKTLLLNKIKKNDSKYVANDNGLNEFTEFWPYFIFLFLLLLIFFILISLILKNCWKNKNFKVPIIKINRVNENKSLSCTDILNNILSSTKNSNTLDKNKINNEKLREYFNEKIKKEGSKVFQDKIYAVFNTPIYSSSQTVDSETHNILCSSVSVIPVIYIKHEDGIIK